MPDPTLTAAPDAAPQYPLVPSELLSGRAALAGLTALLRTAHEGRFRQAGPSAHQLAAVTDAIGWKLDRGLDDLS